MGKAYVKLKYRKKVVKLFANDIAKIYKVNKRKTPSIPFFEGESKCLPETDLDNEVSQSIGV